MLNALTTYAEAKYCTIYCDEILSDCLNLCVCLCIVSNAIKQQDKCTCADIFTILLFRKHGMEGTLMLKVTRQL